MATVTAGLRIEATADTADAERGLDNVGNAAKAAGTDADNASMSFGKLAGAAFAGGAALEILKKGFEVFIQVAQAANASAMAYMETTTAGRMRLAMFNETIEESNEAIGRAIAQSNLYVDSLNKFEQGVEKGSGVLVQFIGRLDQVYGLYTDLTTLTRDLDQATGGWLLTIGEGVASLNPIVAALNAWDYAIGVADAGIGLLSDTVDALTGEVAVAVPFVEGFGIAWGRVANYMIPARREIERINAEMLRGRAAASVSDFAGGLVGFFQNQGEPQQRTATTNTAGEEAERRRIALLQAESNRVKQFEAEQQAQRLAYVDQLLQKEVERQQFLIELENRLDVERQDLQRKQFERIRDAQNQEWQLRTDATNQILGSLQSSVSAFSSVVSTAFEGLVAGTDDFGRSLGANTLKMLGSLSSQVGSFLLLAGIGFQALPLGFKAGPAIGAGLGLLALGAALGGAGSRASNSGTASPNNPTSSRAGGIGPTATEQRPLAPVVVQDLQGAFIVTDDVDSFRALSRRNRSLAVAGVSSRGGL